MPAKLWVSCWATSGKHSVFPSPPGPEPSVPSASSTWQVGAQQHPHLWPTCCPVPLLLLQLQQQWSQCLFFFSLLCFAKIKILRILHNPCSLHRHTFRQSCTCIIVWYVYKGFSSHRETCFWYEFDIWSNSSGGGPSRGPSSNLLLLQVGSSATRSTPAISGLWPKNACTFLQRKISCHLFCLNFFKAAQNWTFIFCIQKQHWNLILPLFCSILQNITERCPELANSLLSGPALETTWQSSADEGTTSTMRQCYHDSCATCF